MGIHRLVALQFWASLALLPEMSSSTRLERLRTSNTMRREGLNTRLGAALIDTLIIHLGTLPLVLMVAGNMVTFVMSAVLVPFTDGKSGANSDLALGRAATGLAVMFCVLLAYSLCDVFLAATPGKLLLGLRISNDDGTPASLSQRVIRWSIKYAWIVPYVIFLAIMFTSRANTPASEAFHWIGRLALGLTAAGFLLALRPNRQSACDLAAHTAVFRVKS